MSDTLLKRVTSIYTDKSINGWVRGIAWIGTAAVLYIIGNAIVKNINAAKSAADQAARQAQLDGEIASKMNGTGTDASGNAVPAQNPSYADSQYAAFADAIQNALSGCDFTPSATLLGILSDSGTAVYNVIQNINNDVDFLKLEKAYGLRTISKSWYCGYLSDITNADMETALTRVLDSQEISYLNNYMAGKGISYKF